ncbi:MAG: hypothetical protein M1839_003147 [Geoglossum umbratile]|nr:MAG: hypothetical protein M1839_003147 [Geoglossum umbratile]
MSPPPENQPAGRPARGTASDLSAHYVYKPASAACTQRIIDEGLQAPSSMSFTSAQPSPAPSVRSLDLECVFSTANNSNSSSSNDNNNNASNSNAGGGSREAPRSYKQALAEGRGPAVFQPRFPTRQQSWNEQDLKRAMQQGMFAEGGSLQGFSDGGYTSAAKEEGK